MNENSITPWIALLNSEDMNQRSKAVLELGKLKDLAAVDPLVDVLCNDSELNIQEDATWALVKIGEASVPPLVKALKSSDAGIRHNAAHTLGKIAHKSAVEALIGVLNDEAKKVRLKAVYALGQIGDSRAIDHLIDRLGDADNDVRWTAVEVIEGFGAEAVSHLIPGLKHPQADVREGCASALGHSGDSRAVEPLVNALQDEDAEVRLVVIQALGEIGDSRAADPVHQLTNDDDARIRAMASAMGKML